MEHFPNSLCITPFCDSSSISESSHDDIVIVLLKTMERGTEESQQKDEHDEDNLPDNPNLNLTSPIPLL